MQVEFVKQQQHPPKISLKTPRQVSLMELKTKNCVLVLSTNLIQNSKIDFF
jgi:hypothetical protein